MKSSLVRVAVSCNSVVSTKCPQSDPPLGSEVLHPKVLAPEFRCKHHRIFLSTRHPRCCSKEVGDHRRMSFKCESHGRSFQFAFNCEVPTFDIIVLQAFQSLPKRPSNKIFVRMKYQDASWTSHGKSRSFRVSGGICSWCPFRWHAGVSDSRANVPCSLAHRLDFCMCLWLSLSGRTNPSSRSTRLFLLRFLVGIFFFRNCF